MLLRFVFKCITDIKLYLAGGKGKVCLIHLPRSRNPPLWGQTFRFRRHQWRVPTQVNRDVVTSATEYCSLTLMGCSSHPTCLQLKHWPHCLLWNLAVCTLLFMEGNCQLQAQKNFLMLSSSLMGDPFLENVNSPSLEIFHQRLKVLGWEGGSTRQLRLWNCEFTHSFLVELPGDRGHV